VCQYQANLSGGTVYDEIMAILQKLKSLLGLDESESERGCTREVGVTVEREGTADDGTAADADRDETVDDASVEPTQSAATGLQRDDSTESTAAESADTSDESPVEEAEPDVATEPEPDTETADSELAPESAAAAEAEADTGDAESETVDDIESEPESVGESESEAEPEPEPEPETDAELEETNPEPVVEIKGIGPAYADRLAGAGVDTIGELAVADAAELAEQTDISETRIQGWIDRAEVR